MKIHRDVIIIPTYNEKDGITKILQTTNRLYPDMEIWVVDDNSPDGTAGIVSKISESNPNIKLISRKSKTGLGDAYKETLAKIQKINDIRFVVTMDADGSHNPLDIKKLIEALEKNDLSIGSRYVKGGGVKGWGFLRNLISRGGNLYARIITGSPVRDATAGFVAFRKTMLDRFDVLSISSSGYSYQIEFKNKILEVGGRFCEVPIIFTDREDGQSKMSGRIVIEGMFAPWKIAGRLILKKRNFINTFKKAILAFLVFFTLFFSLYRLSESPSVWYDEGFYFQTAANLAGSSEYGIRFSPEKVEPISKMSVGYPLLYPLAAVFKVFGSDIIVARQFMLVYLVGFILSGYFLAKRAFGKNIALGSLALLATFPPLYGNGKAILGEVPGSLYLILALLFMNYAFSGRPTQKSLFLILTGLLIGLSAATKPIFLLGLPALGLVLLIKFFSKRLSLKDLLMIGVPVLIPILIWIFTQFNHHDSFSTILGFYANPSEISDIPGRFLANLRGLVAGIGPIYILAILLIWTASVLIRRAKKENFSLPERVAFVFSILVFLAYFRTGGFYRYIFPAQIVGLIYFPHALYSCLNCINLQKYFIILIITSLSVFGTYQLVFDSWVADFYESKKTAFWTNYFDNFPEKTSLFFYNTPEVALFDKGKNYYQYLTPFGGPFGQQNLAIIKSGKVDKIIIETSVFEGDKEWFLKKYRPERQVYKYTILENRSI